MREGEKEMISILGSKDRSVSGKILIIQLWSPNENYSFFVRCSVFFSFSSSSFSLNYFFYSVLYVHSSVIFFLHSLALLIFAASVPWAPMLVVMCALLIFSFFLSFTLCCCFLIFILLSNSAWFVGGLCIWTIVFSLNNLTVVNEYVLCLCLMSVQTVR